MKINLCHEVDVCLAQVLLLGSTRAFGNWNTSDAVRLSKMPLADWWWVDVMIPVGDTICFKFAIQSAQGRITWEPILDRSATIPDSLGHSLYFRYGEAGLLSPRVQVSPQLMRAFCKVLSKIERGRASISGPHGHHGGNPDNPGIPIVPGHDKKARMGYILQEGGDSIEARLRSGEAAAVDLLSDSSRSVIARNTGASAPPSSAGAAATTAATAAATAITAAAVTASAALAAPRVLQHGLSTIAWARFKILTRPPPKLTQLSPSAFGRDFMLETLRATSGRLRGGLSSSKSRLVRSESLP